MKRIFLFFTIAIPVVAAIILSSPQEAVEAGNISDLSYKVRLPIVMYHHISENPSLLGPYVISVQEFEDDLRYLKQSGCTSITMQQLFDWYNGNFTMPEKPCIITFDDGFESTGAYAAPLLEKYGYTGIVALIGSVAEQYTVQPDHNLQYSHLSWEAASELAASGALEFQCHTWDMHKLSSRRGCGQMQGEDDQSYRSALSADLSKFLSVCAERGLPVVDSIAYPFGFWNQNTLQIVKDMGFRAAFTCSETINTLTGKDTEELYHLNRFNRPHGVSSEAFFAVWDV